MTNETDKIEADIDRSRHALNNTIEAFGGKLTPGQMVDEAMGLLQGQAGQFSAKLGRQARDNPIPLLLIAAGAALFFTSKHKDSLHSSSVQDSENDLQFTALQSARASVVRGAEEDESAWSHRLHAVEAKALGLQQDAGEALEVFKNRVKSAGLKLGESAALMRDRFASGVSHAGHAVADGAHHVAHFATDQAGHAKHAAGALKHRAQDFYSDNPLAAGAIGLAIGALIGGATPLSSLERDNLQGLADAAARKGADLAGRGARAAEGLADKALSAAS